MSRFAKTASGRLVRSLAARDGIGRGGPVAYRQPAKAPVRRYFTGDRSIPMPNRFPRRALAAAAAGFIILAKHDAFAQDRMSQSLIKPGGATFTQNSPAFWTGSMRGSSSTAKRAPSNIDLESIGFKKNRSSFDSPVCSVPAAASSSSTLRRPATRRRSLHIFDHRRLDERLQRHRRVADEQLGLYGKLLF